MKKYKLTDTTKNVGSMKFHRIECVKAFGDVKVGDLGGWIEKENNLDHEGEAWIYDDAHVCGDAIVYENAKVRGKAWIDGRARISGDAEIGGHAGIHGRVDIRDHVKIYDNAQVWAPVVIRGETEVFGNAEIEGDAWINGDAKIKTSMDYTVHRGQWTPGGIYFTYTSSNKLWSSDSCRFQCLTGEELIKAAYEISKFAGQYCEVMVEAQMKADAVREVWERKRDRLNDMETIMRTCSGCIEDRPSTFECPFRDAQGECGFHGKMMKAINSFASVAGGLTPP